MVSEQNIFWFIGIYSAVEGIFKLGVKYAKQMWTSSTKSRGIAGALVTKPLLTLGEIYLQKGRFLICFLNDTKPGHNTLGALSFFRDTTRFHYIFIDLNKTFKLFKGFST